LVYEDFTTYEEEDPLGHISKTASRVTVTNISIDEVAYVVKDKGVDHFDGDFEHLIDIRCTARSGENCQYDVWSLGNTKTHRIGEAETFDVFFIQYGVDPGTLRIGLIERHGNVEYMDISTTLFSNNTTYYLKIKRDESIGTYGRLYCYIYSDAARTSLIETLQLDLHAKTDFRYVFGCRSVDANLSGRAMSGYEENLNLQEGVAHYQTISEVLGMVDSVAKRADLKQAVTEKLGMIDSAVAPGTLHLTVAEKLGLLDFVAFPIRVTIMESLGMVDSVAKRADLKQPILESLGLLDSTVPRRGLKQTVTEQLGLLDSAVPRLLMRKIPDLIDHRVLAGAPEFLDLPDNVEAAYVSVKNTWQDAENLDAEHGYVSYVWIPEETFKVRIMKLHVYAEKFRAYSKAAAAGGAQVVTSVAAGAHRHKMFDWLDETPGGWSLNEFRAYDEFGYLRRIDLAVDVSGRDLHTYEEAAAHTHDVSLPNHTHPIDFGIYEEAITGRTLSAKLYDPDNQLVKDFGVILTGESDLILDLSQYFEALKYGMYRLELTASARLRARLVYYELCLMYAY